MPLEILALYDSLVEPAAPLSNRSSVHRFTYFTNQTVKECPIQPVHVVHLHTNSPERAHDYDQDAFLRTFTSPMQSSTPGLRHNLLEACLLLE